MSTVTITLNNKKFNLECAPKDQDYLVALASKIDDEITKIIKSNEYISFELALVIISLKLMAFKQSELKISGGQILENLEQEHQLHMTDISEHLSTLLKKIDTKLEI
ncbi:MAG: cell division protein ZapA [Rickettsiaceae bacterium]|nr:cell division protein ZapA [Rickettsiaceae bacterium]